MLEKIIEFFKSLKRVKPKKGEEPVSANDSLFLEAVPEYEEGYNEKENVAICLVSNKRASKPYQVKGIEDVASTNNWKAWLYLGPVIVLIAIFLLYPLINTIIMAFTYDYILDVGPVKGPNGYFTFDNFGIIFGLIPTHGGGIEYGFRSYALINTIIIVFVTVPIATALALLISVALNSIKWFQKALQTIFFLPYVTNAIAVGMVFSVLFSDTGLINNIFGSTGFHWITMQENQYIALIPLCLYIVWNSIPFKILIFLSGLQGIDKQYYQAAQIDAAPKWKVLLKVTVPLLSPQILYIMVTSFIGAFKEYSSVIGMFGPEASSYLGVPNMQTIVYYVYKNLSSNTAQAAAAAVFLFVIILAFTFLQFGVSKKRVHY